MDVLLQDLGTIGVINLYGEQLRESRLRCTELENHLALKTSECEAISRVAQQVDANRSALQNELHRLTTDANLNQPEPYPNLELEEEGPLGAWSGPGLEVELAEKNKHIELLVEQLEQQGAHVERLAETLEREVGVEERQRQKIHELETSLAKHRACEREYQDMKRRMKEMQDSSSTSSQTRQVVQAVSSSNEDNSDEDDAGSCVYPALPTLKCTTFDHLQQMVSAFSSPTQLPPYDKQKNRLPVRHIDVLQRFMASQRPSKTFLLVRRVMKCGSHAWVPGPLYYWAGNKWIQCSSYKKYHDKTIELFIFGLSSDGSCNISYMGNYQAIKLPELRNTDFTKLSRAYQSEIERQLRNEHKLSTWQARNDILQGRVVLECLGLQYRTFDHVLHNVLMSFQGPANARKRKFMDWRSAEEESENEPDECLLANV